MISAALLSARSFQYKIESCESRKGTFAHGSSTFNKISQKNSRRDTIRKYKTFASYSYVKY